MLDKNYIYQLLNNGKVSLTIAYLFEKISSIRYFREEYVKLFQINYRFHSIKNDFQFSKITKDEFYLEAASVIEELVDLVFEISNLELNSEFFNT